MYTSDKPVSERSYAAVIRAYLLSAVLCALFGAVYELFSHGVWSCFMVCAFALPLLLGVIPFFLMWKHWKPFPGRAADLIHAGVAALTVGSILQGVLEIYGTSNPLTAVYWAAGGVLVSVGWLLTLKKQAGREQPPYLPAKPPQCANDALNKTPRPESD
ncbi:MAG: hypothetical protein Q4E45_11115 [Eubacteriales bacterium]|nr:hypothetical protein [Eubacteriales bacterium]